MSYFTALHWHVFLKRQKIKKGWNGGVCFQLCTDPFCISYISFWSLQPSGAHARSCYLFASPGGSMGRLEESPWIVPDPPYNKQSAPSHVAVRRFWNKIRLCYIKEYDPSKCQEVCSSIKFKMPEILADSDIHHYFMLVFELLYSEFLFNHCF